MLQWYVGGLLAALATSWIAALFHSRGIAPIGLVSVGVGLVLGASLAALAATGRRPQGGRVAGRRRLIIGTLVLALATALAQHAWLYLDFRRQWQEARTKSAEVALFRPETPWSPAEYFARELTAQNAALWALDACLIAVSALGVVMLWQRQQE